MSIFRKAEELSKLPNSVTEAMFDNNDITFSDDFESLIKEASNARGVYENRLKNYKKAQTEVHQFEKPQPSRYSDLPGGIRRVGEGKRFNDENFEMFGSEEKIRSISYDNNKYAESLLSNGFSIWEPAFDELQEGFSEGQQLYDERMTAAQKIEFSKKSWEDNQLNQIRKANVLPYRGLGVSRLGNEQPIRHGDFGSVNEFYAEAHDNIRDIVRASNEERKTKITRKGVDPNERRDAWQNKAAIEARTMESMSNSSFLADFVETLSFDD